MTKIKLMKKNRNSIEIKKAFMELKKAIRKMGYRGECEVVEFYVSINRGTSFILDNKKKYHVKEMALSYFDYNFLYFNIVEKFMKLSFLIENEKIQDSENEGVSKI